MLVLQIYECSIRTLFDFIDEDNISDFTGSGFIEIWLADYTGIEAYGDLELFCLYPPSIYWDIINDLGQIGNLMGRLLIQLRKSIVFVG